MMPHYSFLLLHYVSPLLTLHDLLTLSTSARLPYFTSDSSLSHSLCPPASCAPTSSASKRRASLWMCFSAAHISWVFCFFSFLFFVFLLISQPPNTLGSGPFMFLPLIFCGFRNLRTHFIRESLCPHCLSASNHLLIFSLS